MNCQLRDNNEGDLMQSSSEETWPADSVVSTQYKEKLKTGAKAKGFYQTPKKLTVYSLLTQIAELRKENRVLKKMLIDKNKSPERCRFRLRRIEGRSTPLRKWPNSSSSRRKRSSGRPSSGSRPTRPSCWTCSFRAIPQV